MSSAAQAVQAIGQAREVLLTSYILRPGPVRNALEAAARRGAHVTVYLEGKPYADTSRTLVAQNQATAKRLTAAGAHVQMVYRSHGTGPFLHMKALLCDSVAYLDDRNWNGDGGETILRDDSSAHVRAVRAAAMRRRAPAVPDFWTTKRDAIAGEARLLYGSMRAHGVEVESESFGRSKETYGALKHLALRHVKCRLLVAQRELSAKSLLALHALQRDGVEVRTGDFNEKIAVVDGKHAWAGSANATWVTRKDDQIDWGLRTDSNSVVHALRKRFLNNWKFSQPLDPQQRLRVGAGYGGDVVHRKA